MRGGRRFWERSAIAGTPADRNGGPAGTFSGGKSTGMSQSATILNAVVPVFGVMALGMFIRRLNWLTGEADQSLMRVCVNVLLPCLILDKSLGNPALAEPS